MGEAKERADEIDALKKQEEERQRQIAEYAEAQKKADEELKALTETYLSKEEAEKKFADNKLEAMKIEVIRRKWLAQVDALQDQVNQIRKQLAALDDRMAQISFDDALTFRRTLNPRPGMGEPVGGTAK